MSAIVALTAQNTVGVTRGARGAGRRSCVAQLEAVFSRHRRRRREDRDALLARRDRGGRRRASSEQPVPLVVDPVMVASLGRAAARGRRGRGARRAALPARDRRDAEPRRGARRSTGQLAGIAARSSPSGWSSSARRRRSSPAATATPVDHLFDGRVHVEIPVERLDVARDARRGLHALGDAGRAARARAAARGRGARRGAAATEAVATGSPRSARATGPSTSST